MSFAGTLKERLYYFFAVKNEDIKNDYNAYVHSHLEQHRTNRLEDWKYLLHLNWKYRIKRKSSSGSGSLFSLQNDGKTLYYLPDEQRMSLDDLYALVSAYDLISFDVFDTCVFRSVEFPNDVFSIMALEMGHNDFTNVRKKAESTARNRKFKACGTREVTLREIYDILATQYGIDPKWADRECELEIALAEQNPYIHKLYTNLLSAGKRIIFTSDMYLSNDTIQKILEKCGYTSYEKLYLSNEYGLQKGNGTLQKKLLEDYPAQKIIHIGDNEEADVRQSKAAGIDSYYNPGPNLPFREADMDNLGGSIYRAIINSRLNNGTWNESLAYTHGFRVGGILAVGYCQYLNRLAKEQGFEKILFCARDCEILYRIYQSFFHETESEYIEISRYAVMQLAPERYLYDLSNRYIMRYMKLYRSSKTVEAVLCESGFSYLCDYLEEADINRYAFPGAVSHEKLEQFILNHRAMIEAHNADSVRAAMQYFDERIGSAKKILIVDIGWSGTCITALKYFLNKCYPGRFDAIGGALLCTSRSASLINSLSGGEIQAYVCSPFVDMDLCRFMMPAKQDAKAQDLLHMPLEFLFTSSERSLAGYAFSDDGTVRFERMGIKPANTDEIRQMQEGMTAFAQTYCATLQKLNTPVLISPYVAFNPLAEAIRHPKYCYAVYGNFTYDAFTAPYMGGKTPIFSSLFDSNTAEKEQVAKKKKTSKQADARSILFVTPDLTYKGAPRSLLRMCKVARELGYASEIWSMREGPFADEFEKNGFSVRIVPESDLHTHTIKKTILTFDLAVCNTIETDRYAKVCGARIPTVWYIREATNIPDFIRDNPTRDYFLKHTDNIICVSEYAAQAIAAFTDRKIGVVKNCVEDEVEMAKPYVNGSSEKIRFVQFGTMEYRKGYDVLLAAFLALPEPYRKQAELYFAGGFINSGSAYCNYLFAKMKGVPDVHYLGEIRGEERKIEALSQMDVVVVASRDESCSLVALEGAMLSKPLIVTENVGAKYMVTEQNGRIVRTADVEDTAAAMMYMIDHRVDLPSMGEASRRKYEEQASMESYTKELGQLFKDLRTKKNTGSFALQKIGFAIENSTPVRDTSYLLKAAKKDLRQRKEENVIVSMTSHPGRIHLVSYAVESLLKQIAKPKKILLWLSEDQFLGKENDLPASLVRMAAKNPRFEIRWVKGDLKPHKKYFYAMQAYPDVPIIIVDDDVIYNPSLVGNLMDSYRAFPDCISCMRANLMTFRDNGELREYGAWNMDYKLLLDVPSYQLMPTGVGGVLYPPHSIGKEAFNEQAITGICLNTDDIWLKLFAVYNGYKTVVPRAYTAIRDIPEAKETALGNINVLRGNNDVSLQAILAYFDRNLMKKEELLQRIWQDRYA